MNCFQPSQDDTPKQQYATNNSQYPINTAIADKFAYQNTYYENDIRDEGTEKVRERLYNRVEGSCSTQLQLHVTTTKDINIKISKYCCYTNLW